MMRVLGVSLAVGLLLAPVRAANWSVARVNHSLMTPPAGVAVEEMSGVTYVGPVGGEHRFLAAQQNHQRLVQFDLALSAAGSITAINNVTSIAINPANDFEGIAFTNAARHSVFLSEETNPGVREINLNNGLVLQTVAIPPVFTANKRTNRGFESLTRTLDATAMWTATEEALTVDGPVATAANGTTVRLLQLAVAGNAVTAGSQFAYEIEPIHGTSTLGAPQSGLSDLVVMPDGALLALERSVALTSPVFLNRIYEIDLVGATDVSVGALGSGLTGASYAPVTKTLLWSGAADGVAGQNLEGLAIGPRLANGSWVLIGVVDDNPTDSDTLSANTVVAFVATAQPSADFHQDGHVDGADFLPWQRGLGTTIGATLAAGDADRDGDVDAADLGIWKAAQSAATAVPEPVDATSLAPVLGSLGLIKRRRRRGRRRCGPRRG